ncbi:MAG: DUF1995 family protein [Oscillatoria sp. PMC 1068.18]|nr:DUF1995 family protein [Oscillatoria sp. PMC 1076.18]MEC4988687.1 DUF1995 family protein [Oscillatoria sp. PMC 1068.18]
MVQLPLTLEEAIAQAKAATTQALNDGQTRLQVELVFPEIALRAQALAQDFIPIFEQYGSGLKVLFPDTGAAALARRDWGETPYKVSDLGSSRTPIETKVNDEDEAFLLVCPTSVEVSQAEKLANLAGSRPILMLIPQLENVAIVGIGYAARQLRERFLNTIETCYYIRPLEGAAILRSYPSAWQVWLEKDDHNFTLIAEEPEKPMGDRLNTILGKATATEEAKGEATTTVKKPSMISKMQQFIRALTS